MARWLLLLQPTKKEIGQGSQFENPSIHKNDVFISPILVKQFLLCIMVLFRNNGS